MDAYCEYLASMVSLLRGAEAALEESKPNDRRIPFIHILTTTFACHLERAVIRKASPAAELEFVSSIGPSVRELGRHVAASAILKTPTPDEVESFQKAVVEISRAFLERDRSMLM